MNDSSSKDGENLGLFIVGRKLQSDLFQLIPSEIVIKGKIKMISVASTNAIFLSNLGVVYAVSRRRIEILLLHLILVTF